MNWEFNNDGLELVDSRGIRAVVAPAYRRARPPALEGQALLEAERARKIALLEKMGQNTALAWVKTAASGKPQPFGSGSHAWRTQQQRNPSKNMIYELPQRELYQTDSHGTAGRMQWNSYQEKIAAQSAVARRERGLLPYQQPRLS